MDPLVCSFDIPYRFAVQFTHGCFDASNACFRDLLAQQNARRVFLAIDEGVAARNPGMTERAQAYLGAAGVPGSVHVLPGGEAVKEDDTLVKRLYALMAEEGLCRHSCVAAVGGGALLDVVGFAAATFHRGIGHVRFPSTLLSQADAGVGVKNGYNFAGRKNWIGTFAPPLAVISDLDLLASLDPAEMRAGLSEAVKVGIIRDASFFEWIEASADALRQGSAPEVGILARRCAALHVRHIGTGGDPFERGSRRPLDFGHWAAHNLEPMSGFRLRHGEAVAVGIALDSIYAALTGSLTAADLERILVILERLGLPVFDPELLRTDELLAGLDEFREHLGGTLCITLPLSIGCAHEVHAMEPTAVREAVRVLEARTCRNENHDPLSLH